jgi:pyruvate,water dikinase
MSPGVDPRFAISLNSLPDAASQIAGGKGANLSSLARAGFPVPPGFVVCTDAFASVLGAAGREDLLRNLIAGVDVHEPIALEDAAAQIRTLILRAPLPAEVEFGIRRAYLELDRRLVAVRSSAVGEDSEAASFAGLHETFLGVLGPDAVIARVRDCWTSFFTPRAIYYRRQRGVVMEAGAAVVVQEMVAADISGVTFTVDPIQRRHDRMVIEAVRGLGEVIVSGRLTPDHYVVDRSTGSLIRKVLGFQPFALMYDQESGKTIECQLPEATSSTPVLTLHQLARLRKIALRLEALFGAPQDIEWSFRGGELLLLQSRPISTV